MTAIVIRHRLRRGRGLDPGDQTPPPDGEGAPSSGSIPEIKTSLIRCEGPRVSLQRAPIWSSTTRKVSQGPDADAFLARTQANVIAKLPDLVKRQLSHR